MPHAKMAVLRPHLNVEQRVALRQRLRELEGAPSAEVIAFYKAFFDGKHFILAGYCGRRHVLIDERGFPVADEIQPDDVLIPAAELVHFAAPAAQGASA